MSDERIKKAYDLAEKYGTAERECRWHESGLDADDCFRDLMIYIKGLVARIAELEAAQRWIPVGERLPEEKQDVLALDKTGTAYHWEYSRSLSNIFVSFYTHWMPLPKLPEVQE